MKTAADYTKTICACDLRQRRWNPGTGRCQTCDSTYEDHEDHEDQHANPSPTVHTDRRPTWEIVISYVEQLVRDSTHISLGIGQNVLPLVIVDMHARDSFGLQHYGIPLTSGDGRDHLVEAYEEMLDASVYLTNALDEHGVGLTTDLTKEAFPDKAHRWYLHDVQQLCTSQIRALIHLRAIMEERNRRSESFGLPSSIAAAHVDSTAVVEPGQRHAVLKALAARMRFDGSGYSEIEAELLATNKTRCSPPKTDDEVRAIARWAAALMPLRPRRPVADDDVEAAEVKP